jgi:hypothetical protein
MPLTIVHLSDIHLASVGDVLFQRIEAVANSIIAEVQHGDVVALVLSGDLSHKGATGGLVAAKEFIERLQSLLVKGHPTATFELFIVPGNHDCDFSSDQEVRELVVESVKNLDLPGPGKLQQLLSPLHDLFALASAVTIPENSLTQERPLYNSRDVAVDGKLVRFHLLNSAWMSRRHESPGTLFFPVKEIVPTQEGGVEFAITIVHHPFNWFQQPLAMRPLRARIEEISNVLMTGHEHSPLIAQKTYDDDKSLLIVEGGVLQEGADESSFNVLRVELGDNAHVAVATYSWAGDFYSRSEPKEAWTPFNRTRKDLAFPLSGQFDRYLDDPELPITDAGSRSLRLRDIYTFPDLRDFRSTRSSNDWKRVKAEDALQAILDSGQVVISGADSAGKTSLAKTLFRHLHSEGNAPLFVNGKEIRESSQETTLRKLFAKQFRYQYEGVPFERFEQLAENQRSLIVDDFDEMILRKGTSSEVVDYFRKLCPRVILFVSEDFAVEQAFNDSSCLLDFKRYALCEFGYLRIEDLAKRWVGLFPSLQLTANSTAMDEVRRICKLIQQALKSNSIPHHPWVLLVLLLKADSLDEPAAKNGSYGHLYNAVIVAALARSRLKHIDLKSKYAYLGNLAFTLYSGRTATLSDIEMNQFHNRHCVQFDLQFDYELLRDDLVSSGILRNDGGYVAFHAKYSYCFFLAWYLAHQRHKPEVRQVAADLSNRLYHDESANTVIFLAHLSSDPLVLHDMIGCASRLYASREPANLEDDVRFLDELSSVSIPLALPSTSSEDNRRKALESQDEVISQREPAIYDGRGISTHPEDSLETADKSRRAMYEIRAANKTIQILGQVLRNEVGAFEAEDKQQAAKQIFLLARRTIADYLIDTKDVIPHLIPEVVDFFRTRYESEYREEELSLKSAEIDERSKRQACDLVFGVSLLITLQILKHVAESVGLELLGPTFSKVLEQEDVNVNRAMDLALSLSFAKGLPKTKAVKLYNDLQGEYFMQNLVRLLVTEHLYLYDVPMKEKQSICEQMDIRVPKGSFDPGRKKLGG